MSQTEFDRWCEFYKAHPFDDRHRYHRPAALVATAFAGGGNDGLDDRLSWLSTGYKEPDELTGADRDLFKALGIKT